MSQYWRRNNTSSRDSALFEIVEFAGITSLRLKQYDKAINYFSRMEMVKGLHINYGMFYHAVALMDRNKQGDRDEAKKLLQIVIDNNLVEKEKAETWLKSWEK